MPRALITGCSSGIGRALVHELARRGYDVVATARKVETLDDLPAVQRLHLDVTDNDSVLAAFEAAGDVDVLVNNAGITCWGPVETLPLPDIERLVDTNVLGPVRCVKAALPGMRERGSGAIVTVSSATARGRGGPGLGFYTMTKHAVEVMCEMLRAEVTRFGIRVIVVEPGAIESSFPQNRVIAGFDEPGPYADFGKALIELIGSARSSTYPSSTVAEVIADALEEERPALRRPGSPDAVAIVERGAALDEATFEANFWASVDA
ncbi:MAG: SDR family oxidoreductase [Acidimicrobiia bacterium]